MTFVKICGVSDAKHARAAAAFGADDQNQPANPGGS